MKKLSLRAKTWISIALFAAVFVTLICVATFYDFQVSQLLTKNALKPGDYLATDFFGVLGEAIGTTPIFLLIAFCIGVLFWFCLRIWDKKTYNIILAVVFFIGGIVAWWFFVKDITGYLFEHAGNDAFNKNAAVIGVQFFIATILDVLMIFAMKNFKDETIKKLFKFAIVALAAAVLANVIIAIVKNPVGRMRYRAINSDLGQALIESGKVQGYTPWYVINKQPSADVLDAFKNTYDGVKDAFKSFPSGHTCAAGMLYSLMLLPSLFEFKKKGTKVLCWVLPVALTMLVAISRIVCGAHYMSDVTFGGTIAFLSMMLSREIFICRGSHFKAIFAKKGAAVETVSGGNVEFGAIAENGAAENDSAENETSDNDAVFAFDTEKGAEEVVIADSNATDSAEIADASIDSSEDMQEESSSQEEDKK